MKVPEFKLEKFNPSTTSINIRITSGFKIRILVAVQLMKLAAFVLGASSKFEEDDA